jgi:5-methyltetrahydropteroyltriglutamate--homocysteine methyltransferase
MDIQIIFDDIGSYPLPPDATREWVEEIADKVKDSKFYRVVQDAMRQKLACGVDVPTYPQFQDMNQQFLRYLKKEGRVDEPYLITEKHARIVEVDAVEPVAREYFDGHSQRMPLRICVTGPLELYLKEFGATDYVDIYHTFARSVDRFVKGAIRDARFSQVKVVSIDEPSIGINPQILFGEEDIIKALTIASSTAASQGVDVEIHLHSPLHYKLACETPNINVIGLESAANPSYLELVERGLLEETDTFLRVGVARTDIFNLTAVLNEKYNTNVWKDTAKLQEVLTDLETPEVIAKRLEKAHTLFGERIRYAGPDCGLGSWPTQEMAQGLLENTRRGIDRFLGRRDII